MSGKISASLMCADFLDIRRDLELLEEAGVEYLHMDVMDGHFVPNLMLPPDYINALRKATGIPYDIHLMVEAPEHIIPLLELRPDDLVSVHSESTPHVQRAISLIREKGGQPALAINPGTPIEAVRDLLPDLAMVLVMTVNPGYAGQRLIPQCIDKIRRLREMMDTLGYGDIPIEVDGNCSFQNAPVMREAGAEIFVVGSSSVFNPAFGVPKGVEEFRKCLMDKGR